MILNDCESRAQNVVLNFSQFTSKKYPIFGHQIAVQSVQDA